MNEKVDSTMVRGEGQVPQKYEGIATQALEPRPDWNMSAHLLEY